MRANWGSGKDLSIFVSWMLRISKASIHSRTSSNVPLRLLMFRLPITQCLAPCRLRVSNTSDISVSKHFPGSETFNEELDDSKNESLICGKLFVESVLCQPITLDVEIRGAVFKQNVRLSFPNRLIAISTHRFLLRRAGV